MSDASAHSTQVESSLARTLRLADEARQVAEARKSVADEGVIQLAAIRAWADSLDTSHLLPLPQPIIYEVSDGAEPGNPAGDVTVLNSLGPREPRSG